MTKCGAEVSSINIGVFGRPRVISFLAPGAKDFDRVIAWYIGNANREYRLSLTARSGASTKLDILILVQLG